MIILDTNVISEAMKPTPDESVRAWLNVQVAKALYVTSISLAELYFGVARLPEGKRKADTQTVLEFTLSKLFDTRTLVFDQTAAQRYAQIASQTQRQGLALSFADGQIAAIAASHEYIVATRDMNPFRAAGVDVLNPWQAFS